MKLEQNFLQSGWLCALKFTCSPSASLREVIHWFIDVLTCYSLHEVQNFLGICICIFKMKVLQEDRLVSLMVCQVFALCTLYLFRFLDEGFVLNFLRVAWHSLIFLHSSVNHGLLFSRYCGFGNGFIWLRRVLVKCIMGSSWFGFDSEIRMVRHSFW